MEPKIRLKYKRKTTELDESTNDQSRFGSLFQDKDIHDLQNPAN